MAAVYRATHRNHAEFAVKMLHAELSVRDGVRARFLREGKAANLVKHPGVVAIVDDDVAEDGSAFLVMELLHGAPVELLWERSALRLPIRAALSVATQLLDVLDAAHAKGVVHRDIKPANLFATPDGTLKVLDFGIAHVKDAASGRGGQHSTGIGLLLGTPAFMAPEQALGKHDETGPQTDLWAVGATLFTLLTGQTVHVGENAAQLMVAAATQRARPLRSVAPAVPREVAEVIDRSLAFEKRDRWSDASTMRASIEKASLALFGEQTDKLTLATVVAGEGLGAEDDLTRVAYCAPLVHPPHAASAVIRRADVIRVRAVSRWPAAPKPAAERRIRRADAWIAGAIMLAAAATALTAFGLARIRADSTEDAVTVSASARPRTLGRQPAPTTAAPQQPAMAPAAPTPSTRTTAAVSVESLPRVEPAKPTRTGPAERPASVVAPSLDRLFEREPPKLLPSVAPTDHGVALPTATETTPDDDEGEPRAKGAPARQTRPVPAGASPTPLPPAASALPSPASLTDLPDTRY